MSSKYCHRFSPQVKRVMNKLDDMERQVVEHHVEKSLRFRRSSHRHHIVRVPLDLHEFVIAVRDTGELEKSGKRTQVQWDTAFMLSREQPSVRRDLRNHIIASIIVAALGGLATYAYSKLPPLPAISVSRSA